MWFKIGEYHLGKQKEATDEKRMKKGKKKTAHRRFFLRDTTQPADPHKDHPAIIPHAPSDGILPRRMGYVFAHTRLKLVLLPNQLLRFLKRAAAAGRNIAADIYKAG